MNLNEKNSTDNYRNLTVGELSIVLAHQLPTINLANFAELSSGPWEEEEAQSNHLNKATTAVETDPLPPSCFRP